MVRPSFSPMTFTPESWPAATGPELMGPPLPEAFLPSADPRALQGPLAPPPALLGQVPGAGLPSLAAVAPQDAAAATEAQRTLQATHLATRGSRPADAGTGLAPAFLDALRSSDPAQRDAAHGALGQTVEQMWWQNDPRLASLLAALFSGLSPAELEQLMGRMSAPAQQAVSHARRGGGVPRAPQRGEFYGNGKPGASKVARSDKTIRDTNLAPDKVFPPGADKTKALFREAAKLAGVPESWADSPGLHNILAKESGGKVGRPNYTYGARAKDPAQWESVHAELKSGTKSTISSATGLGQLILPNVDRYYPAGRKGIGDPLQEAAGMLAYIKDRYGSPDNAWARYGTKHEGY
jgi:hypothetical protein